ncbi:27 kDa hemolymph protein-like isoform X2 [Leptidea sinapis]|uniref:27 kDa hemolymph protein-like isoform X2 n=1 Tax=Leptidea sinapis TaxID=189913 RepID=UPI0021C48711|nr:27 kDa hemolymph protein-like isoform X2 [Leptidea sinapis]
MIFKYVFYAVIIGVAQSQFTEPSISDALDSLPPELQGKIDEAQIEAIQNKSSEVFKEKCEKNGGLHAFDNAERAFKEFSKCVQALVSPNQLQKEIEDAKPNGQVDEVFKKYCDKTPSFKSCFHNMTEVAQECLSEEERGNVKIIHNISEQLAEFICFKEGDRIALFISENGPECIQEKQEDIRSCVNSTVGSEINFDQNNITADSLPLISFGKRECTKYIELQKCVVSALETCSAPTSANIVEALFKFVLKATPCRDMIDEKKDPNSANGIVVSSISLTALIITALM